VLDLIQAYRINSPAIIGSCDTPVGQEVALNILVSKVVLHGQDDEQRDSLAEGINPLDYHCLLAIARLGQLCLATAIRGRDHYTHEDDAYYKPSLVEVVDIVVHDTVLSLDISYKCKPLANDLRIFALSPLVVVSTRITRLEL